MKVGRKLAIKVLNASKFVLGVSGDAAEDVGEVVTALDRSLLVALADLVDEATERVRRVRLRACAANARSAFFWSFCDDYVELVKSRAYGDAGDATVRSAAVTLRVALSTLLRLLRAGVPYVSEEVWSWWRDGSIHRAGVARLPARCGTAGADPLVYTVAADVLAEVRKVKSTQKVSLATPVASGAASWTPRNASPRSRRPAQRRVRRGQDRQARGRGGKVGGRGAPSSLRNPRREHARRASTPRAGWPRTSTWRASTSPPGAGAGPPTLERISTLMQYLGSPETEFPAVHITGTNGKTTTVRVLTELLTRSDSRSARTRARTSNT